MWTVLNADDGSRLGSDKKYQVGMGVAAATLIRGGVKVVSQRDDASLEILYSKIDPAHQVNAAAIDHHEIAWYKEYFGKLAMISQLA